VDVCAQLGESNVYTIGFIGPHKVVSTKLPAVGRQMAAQISSGNTTTRLLGIFRLVLNAVVLLGMKTACAQTNRSTSATYTYNRLMALCLGLPGWAGAIRNNYPLTPVHY